MGKRLPSIFACDVKSDGNNKDVFYGERKDVSENLNRVDVVKKIDKIFSSSDYIYKADVLITLSSGKINRNIIGRNKGNLITMDNELIPIDNIIDIEKSK